ncbi:MAG: protein-L-isoaspartate(D-aspartate) O-methyltransferase [Gammaproteobacteria bacterium HGW-Gammaproteobacteria-10]|uniref:Protein-L-isoaspartate O-methyltransferase n=1 Tax=Methylotuvimicrobium buryatense TaxID=95641 RepID=A0A4P9UPM5_METBY|nr:protein-L-isoaspartate(D-aspartate) O-methyltransferase [Methylotuvimicrobium buryatense]PKM35309.1 MAG: protein-L-isoaspartate(D-aspartate) O-methyltransferase [Gammaproteobacteria bacterium HGW-Gammaproteobacteria-10]QCW83217.1 protein-L-isoaspartate(D-aspartate) O-methyltransferase [Methylotuvimicrobium buryatense]
MNKQFRLLIFAIMLFGVANYAMAGETAYERQRNRLIDMIQADVRSTSYFLGKDALDEKVLQALRKVPRHEFVPEAQRPNAYLNRPLPIGHGQTISQPYIVAIMTDLLELDENSRVLEIGTGSAYQAAVLAEVAGSVYTIEIIEALADQAARDLKRLGYDKVQSRAGDGYYGWEEAAPFDAIMVTAAASHIPPPLIKQLKPGGRMIIPVGGRFTVQHLVLVNKDQENRITSRQLLPVRFVPLTGDR